MGTLQYTEAHSTKTVLADDRTEQEEAEQVEISLRGLTEIAEELEAGSERKSLKPRRLVPGPYEGQLHIGARDTTGLVVGRVRREGDDSWVIVRISVRRFPNLMDASENANVRLVIDKIGAVSDVALLY